MAPKSKKQVKKSQAGVGKTKKHNANKHPKPANKYKKNENTHEQDDDTSGTKGLPNAKDMLVFNEIDFSPVVDKALVAYAMMMLEEEDDGESSDSGSDAAPPNPGSYFGRMPTEMLVALMAELPAADRLRTALAFPEHFMGDRLNIFVADAYHQLSVPMEINNTANPEFYRPPLILGIVEEGTFTIEELEPILDMYERVAVEHQLDRHVFLNSTFGNYQNLNQPFQPDSLIRHMASTLHMAVQSGRADMVRYLLRRGADPYVQFIPLYMPLTPFQYALDIGLHWDDMFPTWDEGMLSGIEQAGLELAYTSPNPAYMPDNIVSDEFRAALFAGLESIAVWFLRDWAVNPTIDENGRSANPYITARNADLFDILRGEFDMPEVVTLMLEQGARYRNNGETGTTVAIDTGNIQAAVAVFLWELQNAPNDVPVSVERIVSLAEHDEDIDDLMPLARALIDFNVHDMNAQRRLAWNVVRAGQAAFRTRQWVFASVNENVFDGGLLRMAIRHRDRRSMLFVLDIMLARGQSIDERMRPPIDPGSWEALSHFTETPLTFALAQENYSAAAHLLTLGADINLIPPNIRHRVLQVETRVNAGVITNPVAFVYRRGHLSDGSVPTTAEAEADMNFIFGRLNHDANYPVPDYTRHRRHFDRPADHPDNDSNHEDDYHQDTEMLTSFLIFIFNQPQVEEYPNTDDVEMVL